jgi:hypothetical protein
MANIKFLLEKLNRAEKYLGLPLTIGKHTKEQLEKKLKDIRIKYDVII